MTFGLRGENERKIKNSVHVIDSDFDSYSIWLLSSNTSKNNKSETNNNKMKLKKDQRNRLLHTI